MKLTYMTIASKNGKELREDARMDFESAVKHFEAMKKDSKYDQVKLYEVGSKFDNTSKGLLRNWEKNQVKP